MDNIKSAYFSAIRKLVAVMVAAGKNTIDVSMLEDPNTNTINEFVTQIGPQYEYTVVHRGILRIRKK